MNDSTKKKPEARRYEREFWNVADAIAFANGEDGGSIAQDTTIVKVTWTRSGYRLGSQD